MYVEQEEPTIDTSAWTMQERNGNIVIADTDEPIIEQLSRQAFVSDRQRGALVLGFSSAEGAKSMVDTAVGKVRDRALWAAL